MSERQTASVTRKPLRVLVAEDDDDDFELVLRELRRGGYEPEHVRVESGEALTAALRSRPFDVVVSDWQMPSFDAPSALAIVKELAPDLPFIIVSGTVDDETAVSAMRAGAHDFMSKGRLARLVPAIERELREAALGVERRRMEQQLLVSDRMASMGTLAAGVAHEINNPLASVLANLELARHALAERAAHLAGADELRDVLDELRDASEAATRIRDIVRDLKIFSRSSPAEDRPRAIDVRGVLESTLRMAWNEVRHRARLVTRFAETPLVEADESRLGQVFLNLVMNAAQAIPEGHAADHELRVTTGADVTGRAVIDITDTGVGMSAEVLARLFTPFFTTKPIGVGTGLGLSICQRIVNELGGTIAVESEVGRGTTVRVTLPRALAAAAPRPRRKTLLDIAPPRRGAILAIDDDPMVLKVVDRVLSRHHEVATVNSAGRALEAIRGGARYDVILCDLMMPQVTGMDFHAELEAIDPELARRVVFLTGGAFSARTRAFLDATSNARLEKPFRPSELLALVAERLR